ncbi:MAG: transglycosylase SLT domain-containing protein [Pseudomonadota bacterium]
MKKIIIAIIIMMSFFSGELFAVDSSDQNFSKGYLAYKNQKFSEADSLLSKALSDSEFLLKDHALYFRALSKKEAGKLEEAYQDFFDLKKHYSKSVWVDEALLGEARVLSSQKKYDESLADFKKYLKALKSNGKLNIELEMVGVNLDAKRCSVAQGMLKDIILSSRSEDDINKAAPYMKQLSDVCKVNLVKWMSTPEQQYAICKSFAANASFDQVIARALPFVRDKSLSPGMRAQFEYQVARSKRWLHQYDESLKIYLSLNSRNVGPSLKRAVDYGLADVYLKMNNFQEAIRIIKRLQDATARYSGAYMKLKSRLALLYCDMGNFEQAVTEWKEVLQHSSSQQMRARSRWYLGWSYYKMGYYKDALSQFELLQKHFRGSDYRDRSIYWRARVYEKMGEEENARKLYLTLIHQYPTGYYREMASQRLSLKEEKNDIKGNWEPKKSQIKELKKDSVELERVELLMALGLKNLAIKELEHYKSFPSSTVELVLWRASQEDMHHAVVGLISRHYRRVLKDFPLQSGFDRFIWENYYPKAYSKHVEKETSGTSVDPDLVYAMIRNESLFQADVISTAGAVGLMQLMPTTARSVITDDETFQYDSLFDPDQNIRYGIRYLQRLHDYFGGNIVAAIAAYNAGEHAVMRWVKNSNSVEVDEWIEDVPYFETKLYVKKVLNSYWVLKRLYPSKDVPPDYRIERPLIAPEL